MIFSFMIPSLQCLLNQVSLAVVTLIVITLLLLLLFWRSWRKNKVVVSREKNSEEDEVDSDSDYSSYQVRQQTH